MKRIVVVAGLMLLLVTGSKNAGAQEKQKSAVRFTSVYTNLKTQCVSAFTRAEERQAEKYGEDIPSVCRGFGGYEIFLGSHGAMSFFQVQVKSKKAEKDVVVAETLFIADPIYTRKVEWRLANGKPFAVIFRRDTYDEEDVDPTMKKKTGEALRVMGLKRDDIDFTVDVKSSKNPNQEARRLADQAYSK